MQLKVTDDIRFYPELIAVYKEVISPEELLEIDYEVRPFTVEGDFIVAKDINIYNKEKRNRLIFKFNKLRRQIEIETKIRVPVSSQFVTSLTRQEYPEEVYRGTFIPPPGTLVVKPIPCGGPDIDTKFEEAKEYFKDKGTAEDKLLLANCLEVLNTEVGSCRKNAHKKTVIFSYERHKVESEIK